MYSLRAEYITLRSTHTHARVPKTVEKKKKNSLSFVLLARSPYIADLLLFFAKRTRQWFYMGFSSRDCMRECDCASVYFRASHSESSSESNGMKRKMYILYIRKRSHTLALAFRRHCRANNHFSVYSMYK